MIKINYNDVELSLPVDSLDKNTEAFLKVMLPIIHKSIGNPAVQLNALALLHTGKTANELFTGSADSLKVLLSFLKGAIIELTDFNKLDVRPELSGNSIEDFLNGLEG